MNQKGVALVFATAIISGFSIFLNKYAVSGIDSSVFTFSKNLIVAAVLVSLLVLWKKDALQLLTRKDWLTLSVIGLVGGAIPFLLFFRGLQLISGSMGSFIHKTMFIFVAVLAALFLGEKVKKWFFVAAIALLTGNFMLLKMKGFGFGFGAGEMMVLSATLLWAVENTFSKHALKRLDSTTVAAGRMGFGALFIFMFLAATGKAPLIFSLTQNQIGWIIITSVLLLAYVLTWYSGLKHIDVSAATTILMLGSPVTLLFSFAFSSAAVTIGDALGMMLVFAGVFVVLSSKGWLDARQRWQLRG